VDNTHEKTESARVVGWCLLLLASLVMFVVPAPAIVCLSTSVALAFWWCYDLEASGHAMAHRAVRDDRDLHVAGEAHDPLHQAALEQL
jgi:hypothetical protein